jgi:uncharacterized protein (TIGR03083 family)
MEPHVEPSSLAFDERRDLLDFLRDLEPGEWESPTLCSEWCVKDVVAHIVSYGRLGSADLARRFAEGRLSLAGANRLGVEQLRRRTPEELMAMLDESLRPSGAIALLGGRIALTDTLIHHQDIRRPLGRPREIPPERLCQALSFGLIALPIRGAWRLRGVRATATDVPWSYGRGPDVRGPGEAILMTMAGRRGIACGLEGPGVSRLLRRVG